MKSISLRIKLILAFMIVGSLPLIVSSIFSYFETSHEIRAMAQERAQLVAHEKVNLVTSYFKSEMDGIIDLASSPMVAQALLEFSAEFENPKMDGEILKKAQIEVGRFYSEQFSKMYEEKSKQNITISEYFAKIDIPALIAQYDFIVTNENPIGKKDLLVQLKRETPYGAIHSRFHSYFRNFLNRRGLYDLFLVDQNGRVVYTVFKETDFGTSLKNGPWASTALASVFQNSKKIENGKAFIEDFAPYTPSYEAPASFAATPIYKDDKYVGSLIIQLPLDKISAAAGSREGMGEKGETLLLGSDLKLRADTFRNKETHSVATFFERDSKASVDSEAVRKAKSGETGFIENVSYDGLKTLAYYLPVQIENLTWYVVVELSREEIYAGLNKIIKLTLAIFTLGTLLIFAFSFLFGNSVTRKLQEIVATLDKSCQEVSAASSQSASLSTELSEASTEQAASLQETMASAEEIAAMVSQNAETANKTKSAVEQNQKVSDEGSKSVSRVQLAIKEISETNQEIMNQMEESNREFGEIVKIIAEIGEKTNVINEIVFQTKLLSFNASVEAARAGEHGKGFAVVAEEVGNLARMSGSAAKEITDMLAASNRRVNSIIESTKSRVSSLIETGKDKIAMGQMTSEQCRNALNEITKNAHTMVTMITEISNASKEQAQGVQEINKAITQLDQVTQQNTAVAQQSSTQSEQLYSEAVALSGAVKKLIAFVEGHSDQKDVSTEPTQVQNDLLQAKAS